jgi:hypothetical protein
LEQLLVFARPRAAHTVAQTMATIDDATLLRKPDLASAVDGWLLACEGIEVRAVGAWRASLCAATLWRALSRSPSPNVLLMSVYPEKRTQPLTSVFETFLRTLSAEEEEAWQSATSLEAHATQVQRLVDDLVPRSSTLHVAYNV